MARTGHDARPVRRAALSAALDALSVPDERTGPADPIESPPEEDLVAYLPDSDARAVTAILADRSSVPPRRTRLPYVVNRQSGVLHLYPAHEECNLDAVGSDDRDYRHDATLLDASETYCGHCFEVDR